MGPAVLHMLSKLPLERHYRTLNRKAVVFVYTMR